MSAQCELPDVPVSASLHDSADAIHVRRGGLAPGNNTSRLSVYIYIIRWITMFLYPQHNDIFDRIVSFLLQVSLLD